MDADAARRFVEEHHRAVLAVRRAGGGPAMSPVMVAVAADGRLAVSTRTDTYKARAVRRDPRVSLCVLDDGFYGRWISVDGTAEVLALPDAMEPLVDYYRSVSGEHPDWDDYRRAMARDERVLLLITIERAGPGPSG